MTKYFITFLVLIVAGLGAYFIFHLGYYPIAIVNGKVIMASSFKNMYASAYQYYAKAVGNLEQINNDDFKKELKRQVLNQLIERSLISSALKNLVGQNLENLVKEKISLPALDEPDFQESIALLYGLSIADFKTMILEPQAQKEILEKELVNTKTNFSNWLTEVRKTAKVTLLMAGFNWQDGELRD
ncbi:MAG: SurA N-terminal domain-containing protein [Patescibacteria group bacterium]